MANETSTETSTDVDDKAAKAKPVDPKGGRVLTSVMGPKDLETPEQRKAYANTLTQEVVALVQAERKRQGLPPLK